MSTIIKVENLSKRYLIRHQQGDKYQTFRDTIANGTKKMLTAPVRWLNGKSMDKERAVEEFWALKDVSFEVSEGERLGIIGRNGAGKSTLLKVLSRITEPTQGRVSVKGRVASLLEVGTGFHPELTGRENIYLNGAILGMSRAEIQRKFDEIVDFAEIERFLDTPVKRYSSGMYVRLAFAVAAHLEPDILVVDEVLAVGDVAFQKKCMSRMTEVGVSGRTVIFVSHNMGAIEQLCNSILQLSNGEVVDKSNDVHAVINNYMLAVGSAASLEWRNETEAYRNEWFTPTRFYVGDEHGEVKQDQTLSVSDRFFIYIEGLCMRYDPAVQVGVAVYNEEGILIFWSYTTDDDERWVSIKTGVNRLRLELPAFLLNEGVYRIEMGVALYHRAWICEPGSYAPSITLELRGGFVASRYWSQRRPGILAPRLTWSDMG